MKKPMDYIFIAEAPNLDRIIGIRAMSSIKRRLPFDLHRDNHEITKGKITDFKILSVAEWNTQFPMFPLTKCVISKTRNNHNSNV